MTIDSFLNHKKVDKHVKDSVIASYRSRLEKITAAVGKPIEKCTKPELDAYLSGLTCKDGTWNLHLIVLKMYLKYHHKHTLDAVTKKKVTPKDYIMKPEYLQWLLEACKNPRDKCMILVLAKYGFRASEACSIKISGIEFDDAVTGGVYLTISDSKTEIRKVLALGCNAIFREWLTIHPDASNPSAPFICNFEQNIGRPLNRMMLKNFVLRIVRRAHKRHPELKDVNIHAHTLRHFCTTEESKQGLSETSIKQRRGWAKNSGMLATYLHVSSRDANLDYARQSGVDLEKVPKPQVEQKCPKCGMSNLPTQSYCGRCGSPMGLQVIENVDQLKAIAENTRKLYEQKMEEKLAEIEKKLAALDKK